MRRSQRYQRAKLVLYPGCLEPSSDNNVWFCMNTFERHIMIRFVHVVLFKGGRTKIENRNIICGGSWWWFRLWCHVCGENFWHFQQSKIIWRASYISWLSEVVNMSVLLTFLFAGLRFNPSWVLSTKSDLQIILLLSYWYKFKYILWWKILLVLQAWVQHLASAGTYQNAKSIKCWSQGESAQDQGTGRQINIVVVQVQVHNGTTNTGMTT